MITTWRGQEAADKAYNVGFGPRLSKYAQLLEEWPESWCLIVHFQPNNPRNLHRATFWLDKATGKIK